MILVNEYGMVYFITRTSRIFKNRILSLLTHVARLKLFLQLLLKLYSTIVFIVAFTHIN